MTSDHMLELFGGFDPAEYAGEAEVRWGDTEAHRQSARRTAGYSKEDWENLRREDGQINAAFLDLIAAGKGLARYLAAAIAARYET